MKAEELRIGNYVSLVSRIVRINGVTPSEIIVDNLLDGFIVRYIKKDVLSLNPIPLTPAVLEKIKYLPYPIKIIGTHRVGIEISGCRLPACYEYLHQLQNVVYALTNEELEMNF